MHTVRLSVGLALFAGCGNEGGLRDQLDFDVSGDPLPLEAATVTDVLIQTTTPSVDILYMVDDSCSMGDDQQLLIDNFPTFMRWFLGSGLDYHIGVVSSDMVDPAAKGKLKGGFGKRWLSSDDTNQIAQFQQMAVLGNRGAFPERGTGAVFFSMENPAAIEFNAGFFRDQSAIHTIAVSDEKDYSEALNDIPMREFINWYDGLKRAADERSFSAIENPNAVSYRPGGLRYIQVTREIGGVFYDAKKDDWSPALDMLGLRASGRKTEYFLSRVPVDESVRVTVRTPLETGDFLEAEYPRAFYVGDAYVDENGDPAADESWTYVPERNSITFLEFVPDDLAEVRIEYVLRSSNLGR